MYISVTIQDELKAFSLFLFNKASWSHPLSPRPLIVSYCPSILGQSSSTTAVISIILSEQYSFLKPRLSIVRKRLSLLLHPPPFIIRLKNRGFGWRDCFCTSLGRLPTGFGVELEKVPERTESAVEWKM